MAPPPPKTLAQMQLPHAIMLDILLKTMFRMNAEMVSHLSSVICLPVPVTQELVDLARQQRLIEATGTLNANNGNGNGNGNEMGYQLTDQGKARARCTETIRIFWRDARSAGRLQPTDQTTVDPQSYGHA